MPASRTKTSAKRGKAQPTVLVPKNYGLIRKPRKVVLGQPKTKRTYKRVLAALTGPAVIIVGSVIFSHALHHQHQVIPPESPVDSYRVVYRVETPGGPEHQEERDIARPFEGRYLERNGAVISSGFLTTPDGAWAWITSGPAPGWTTAATGMSRATGDQHASAALRAGLRNGLAKVLGRETVLGRPCVEVRTGSPLGQPLTEPTAKDHADLCVDRTGVILSEHWTSGGKIARTRTALSFDLGPAFDATTFRPEPAADASLAGSASATASHVAAPAEQAALGFRFTPPSGYTEAGPLTARVSAGGAGLPSVADFVQYFRNGSDLIDVVQGTQSSGRPPGTPITIAGLGQAYLSLDMTANSITVVDQSGRYAKLEGKDVNSLTAAASGLRAAGNG